MRALGEIRETRAVQALTEQFAFYGKGEGAWSALDALARIAHAVERRRSSRRGSPTRIRIIRRAAAEGLAALGDTVAVAGAAGCGAGNDPSAMVRAAMAFALQKLGQNYARAAGRRRSTRTRPRCRSQGYLLELGPSVAARR